MIPCLCLLWLATATAEAAAKPDWIQKLAPTRPGVHPLLPPCSLTYDVRWKGLVDAGRLTFDVGAKGAHRAGSIVVKSSSRSQGLGASLFPYKGHSWAQLSADSLQPTLSLSTEFKKGQRVEIRNRFHKDRLDCRRTTFNKAGEGKVEDHTFRQPGVFDVASAILFIRSQRLHPGDEIAIAIHPSKSPYLLRARVLERDLRGRQRCLKLALRIHRIDRKSLKLSPYHKIKGDAQLWISDDQARLPLELRAKIFIGDIRVILRDFNKG